jgi:hypothetical protein
VESTEVWVKINGYGDAYSVSDLGRVMRTSPRNIHWRGTSTRYRAKPFKPSFCRAFLNRDGYPQVRIGPAGAQRTVCVHRLVALTFISNPRGVRFVNHIDGDKTNNRVSNLEWVTRKENAQHSVRMGLQPLKLGEETGNAKLTAPEVLAIRKDPRLARIVAADFGVHTSLIYLIRHRKVWQHLE